RMAAGAEAGEGIGALRARESRGDEVVLDGLEHRPEDRLLVGEVMVEGPLRDADPPDERVDRRRGIALPREQLPRDLEQFPARRVRALGLRGHCGPHSTIDSHTHGRYLHTRGM